MSDGNGDCFTITITMRDGMGQINDDYHATVRRCSDGVGLIWISRWKKLLLWKTEPKRVVKAFARYDKRQAKLAKKEVICYDCDGR